MFLKLLFITVSTYLLFIFVLFVSQRTLIYLPDKSRPDYIQGVDIVNVTTKDGQSLEAWYIPPKDPNMPVIVFFHGNAGSYGDRIYKSQHYANNGYGLLLAEYRGYGGNSGRHSEEGFYHDGRAYIKWLRNVKNIKPEKVIIYGESIGSGIAVQMATEYKVAALILEVPFSSLVDVASNLYPFVPVKYLLKDRYMNIDKIENINNAPLLILYGHKDQVIPFSSAKSLFDKATEPKKLIEFPQANHNNLYEFGASQHVLDFLTSIESKNDK